MTQVCVHTVLVVPCHECRLSSTSQESSYGNCYVCHHASWRSSWHSSSRLVQSVSYMSVGIYIVHAEKQNSLQLSPKGPHIYTLICSANNPHVQLPCQSIDGHSCQDYFAYRQAYRDKVKNYHNILFCTLLMCCDALPCVLHADYLHMQIWMPV
jgi:hypothetical protein